MKKVYVFLLLLPFLCISCERMGYYNDGEMSIITMLCDRVWVQESHDQGYTYYLCYDFDSDGTYTQTHITVDSDGKETRMEWKHGWSFGDPAFNTIYFSDYTDYWAIKKLTEKKLEVYERRGQMGEPGYTSEYLEFDASDKLP